MSSLDLDSLIQPISSEFPCGEPALETDLGLFAGLVMGDSPEWQEVVDRCLEQLKASRDLRIGVWLCAALLHTEDGLSGLCDGLKVLCGWIEKYWDQLHPQRDTSDDADPFWERRNMLEEMSVPVGNTSNELRIVPKLRLYPLTKSTDYRAYSLRDIMITTDRLQGFVEDGDESRTSSAINAAFEQTLSQNPEYLQQVSADIQSCLESLDVIREQFNTRLNEGGVPEFDAIRDELFEVLGEVQTRLGYIAENPEDVQGPSATTTVSVAERTSGAIESRQDVLKTIDKICSFYKKQEPASPVPLIMKRARKMVEMNFMQIIEDMAPSAMDDVSRITGFDAEGKNE